MEEKIIREHPTTDVLQTMSADSENTADLLIITDQVDSSKNQKVLVRAHTLRHFRVLIGAIHDFSAGEPCPSDDEHTYVVKNIGDSLMIRVWVRKGRVGDLLQTLLDAQQKISGFEDEDGRIGIRIAVLKLRKKAILEGKELQFDPPFGEGEQRLLPPARWKSDNWLAGDLFGPNINLAFRASQLPADAILVVEEDVAKLVRKNAADRNGNDHTEDRSPFSYAGQGKELWFTESLPFSPIKGVDNIYTTAKSKPSVEWNGHLFLRGVAERAENYHALAREQQKFRAFFRFVWDSAPDLEESKVWRNVLLKLEGYAGYLRSISKVEAEYHLKDRGLAEMPRKGSIGCGMIAAFAGPLDTTFGHIRSHIELYKPRPDKYEYTLSTFVYTGLTASLARTGGRSGQSRELDSPFWPERSPWYVLVFARWEAASRTRDEDEFKRALRRLIAKGSGGYRIERAGLTVGGEWDTYARLVPIGRNVARGFRAFMEQQLTKDDFVQNGIDTLEFYLCRELLEEEMTGIAADE